MKRILIICEGPTEMEFCKDLLYNYFISKDIYLQTPLIKKSGGGIVPWPGLQKQIENHLLQDKETTVTSLIDYYGIKEKHNFPEWGKVSKIPDKNERMTILESAMKNAINDSLRNRFIPYIQLHEFEGLLFNNVSAFNNQIPAADFVNKNELVRTIEQNPNPELINDTENNAPSQRLKRLIKGYNKIVYGAILAQEIGLKNIRDKSFRFNEWIQKLEAI